MRIVVLPLLSLALLVGWAPALRGQTVKPLPKSVLDGAEAATRILSQQVMKGNFSFAVQRMYPRWKDRAAKKLKGGQAELLKRMMELPKVMQKQGITMLKYEVLKPTMGHEVFLGRGVNGVGQPVQMYLEWLVFVPTRAEYQVIDPRTRLTKRVETRGYQVAVVKKGTSDWYFIEGRNLTVPQLRSFFPGLPNDQKLLGLPEVGGGEIKEN